jgi:hypothetical protein
MATESITRPQQSTGTRGHQPGQSVFRSVLPEDIEWKSFPAFPPSARLAVVVGEPSAAGPYAIRVKVPSDVKLNATPTSGGSSLHGDIGRVLHWLGRQLRRR